MNLNILPSNVQWFTIASDVSVQTADDDDDSGTDDVELSYTGFLYYSRHDADQTTINHWLVRFIAVSNKNLDVLEMVSDSLFVIKILMH